MTTYLGRRSLLAGGLALGGAALLGGPASAAPRAGSAPGLLRAGRPLLTSGVQSGDVTARSGIVWARSDRPARMWVEVGRDPSFRRARVVRGPVVTPATDGTGKVRLTGLPSGTQLHYRTWFSDLDTHLSGPAEAGAFRTAPTRAQDVRLVWSGDLAGQGWGIDPSRGGYRIFDAMRRRDPDVFLFSGDTVYADGPLQESVALPDGTTWRNIVTPEKSKVAETLDEYRGQWRYNLLDEAYRAFNAQVPAIVQWDDHEVTNNWYPGEVLEDDRYTERRVDVLAARGKRAFHEYLPIAPRVEGERGRVYRKLSYGPLLDVFVLDMRSQKDANDANDERRGQVLGAEQLAWLEREASASRAVWKVMAADLPIGLVVPDGETAQEGVAQGLGGRPRGRESEVARLLRTLHRRGVENVVWLTADVHYTAAHHYSPDRAAFQDFTPFWEFVSGPLNAGAFGPNALDPTFGPRAVFVEAPPAAGTSPAQGYQFFGEVDVDASDRSMTVSLRGIDGSVRYRKTLRPA
ncbi:alkaline phosphatase D family protein [Vallicoccus soli]|uniref:Alkaline phosphatase n=1 Tax=Vallicoccus soli TaxID=2339232 RepID=A0A3A3YPX6_9ACTN|nr:alkaline phosphatase D family protein [Vallicoccus soli]RJK92651.1 alkaline phosphatase [Vallicoccus soli]